MYTRNALVFAIATFVSAAVAGAQQPKQTTPTRSKATAQAPAAAKPTAKTSAAQALAINSDSAKKIVIANEPGATVTSTHLHRASGKAWYTVNFKAKGEKKTMHATVDATSGAFATVAPSAPATKPAAKKPS